MSGVEVEEKGLVLKNSAKTLLIIFFLIWTAGCIRFQPRPMTTARILDDFEARRLDVAEIRDFFHSQPGIESWPPSAWDLSALTLAAMYYHPDLDVARAQWGVAQAGRITAGELPNPAASVLAGYNSTSPVSEVTPWIPEAALEIPIETAGKRGYRIGQARHLSEAARLNILSVAWEVRSRLRQAFLDLFAAREAESLLQAQLVFQAEGLKILEAQLAAGEASVYEVTQTRIALDSTRLAALDASAQSGRTRVALAAAIGVPAIALDGLAFSFEAFLDLRTEIPSAEVRRRALLGRADILGALSEYEASQYALRVEVAKQYPDISLGPDWQLDQTDIKWTLGLSLILPLFNRNKGPIAEAEALRQESAARFLALQAKVIEQLDGAVAACRAALDKAKTAGEMQASLRKQEATAKVRYEAGEISKLELLGVRLELASNSLARLDALVKAQQAIGELENAMQSPLELKDLIRVPSRRTEESQKERKDE
jgi:cobalt-zinc-cadmium efflux system outer membrane protein